jgi:ankyrin repeat protein
MRLTFGVSLVAAAAAVVLSGPTSAQSPAKIDFARDVQPLLRANCYGCHNATLSSGNFRLDRRRDSMPNRVGANNARIVPGKSDESRLYQRVSGSQAGLQMPPTGALKPEEIRAIKDWIDQGADWPDELAGEAPSPPQDPVATQLLDAIRRGDRATVARLLKQSPNAARAKGTGGITPLMYAALYGDAASAHLLLDMGADPNASNDAGATALLWAVDDPQITRMLLERGADPNARSADGRSPLVLAAARAGAVDVVKALLDRGAKVDAQALAQAADAGDAATMRLLIERGADPGLGTMPTDFSMRSGCIDCVDLLLRSAGKPALTRALESVARYGDSNSMRLLLERGAEPTAEALRLAAASEWAPLDGIATLLERGARHEQALDLAARQGDTPVVALLRKAGGKENTSAVTLIRPPTPRSVRDAISVAVPRLQHVDTVFLKTAGCISCHNNSLFQMTAAAVHQKGFRIDEAAAREQLTRTRAYLESWRERELQDIPIPGRADTTAYILVGLAAAKYPADASTDALARYLKRRQLADGGWRVASHRPPIESSDIAITALVLRSLQAYAPAPLKKEYARAIERGSSWLAQAQAKSNEDHVYMVLGLTWTGASRAAIRKAANALIAQQRTDGGWSQVASLSSDAYATGQALTALAQSGALKPTDPIYERGVRFLLDTQLDDGSWYVHSRVIPIQPYFDSEFPHGKDQFISAAATNWATMALTWAVR